MRENVLARTRLRAFVLIYTRHGCASIRAQKGAEVPEAKLESYVSGIDPRVLYARWNEETTIGEVHLPIAWHEPIPLSLSLLLLPAFRFHLLQLAGRA